MAEVRGTSVWAPAQLPARRLSNFRNAAD